MHEITPIARPALTASRRRSPARRLVASLALAAGMLAGGAVASCGLTASGTYAAPDGSANGGSGSGSAGSGLDTGLPCDVQALIENRCIACHEGPSPASLMNYDALVAPSRTNPAKSVAAVALERMKSASSPMPPPPAVPPEPEEIAALETWVAAGTPRAGACTDKPPSTSSPPTGSNGGTVCTSGTRWNGGNTGSPLMRPGRACNACHQEEGGPNLRIGGTVYPTLHEPDNCNGASPPITVHLVDARNKTYDLAVNEAGNFLLRSGKDAEGFKSPYRASVIAGGKTRAMQGSVTSGDCNACHSETGRNGAPGRILVP